MSEETRRIELAADYLLDTIRDLVPYDGVFAQYRAVIQKGVSDCGKFIAWPNYEYNWKGPYPWKHGPEKEGKDE